MGHHCVMDFRGVLLGIGDPILDITAEVPTEFFDRYDVKPDSALIAEEMHLPMYSDLANNHDVHYTAGGAAQNTIRVAQWMLKQPGATSYFGCIGTDEFGDQLKRCATEDGVNVNYMEDPETPTGTCAVLLRQGERSLIANLAASNNFAVEHLETELSRAIIKDAQFYYFAGFFLTVSLESILTVARHAVDEGKVFTMNLSAPFLIQHFTDQLHAALPYVDYLFGNETEATTFGERKGWGTDIPRIALKLSAEPKASGARPRIVVFTQGAGPTVVAHEGRVFEFPVEPLPKELLSDMNGAGDAFVGGFIAQLVKGASVPECVRAGHWASRVIIQRSGCTFPPKCEFS